MALLIFGMALFIGVHSSTLFAANLRSTFVERFGLLTWKGAYSALAIIGFVLIVMGYGAARLDPTWLYFSPAGLRHFSALLSLIAMIFLAAYILPNNAIKAKLGHPMYLAIKTWAIAHLLVNGSVADVVLFGGLLVWAVIGFIVNRRRDRAAGKAASSSNVIMTALSVILGLAITAVFVLHLHELLIGIKPFA